MSIVTENLVKEYSNGIRALKGVTLHLGSGTIGLLGPNGAGKSTLMRILATLLTPTDGFVQIFGLPLSNRTAIREMLGYLPQSFGFYPQLTVWETLQYFAHLKGVSRSRAAEMLELVGLQEKRRYRVNSLSGGMRQRLGIAVALLNDPRLLIVDEPTAGLDQEARIQFRRLLGNLPGERTVLISSHIADDIAQTCREVVVLSGGEVRFQGSPAELAAEAAGRVWEGEISPDDLPRLEETHTIMSSVRSDRHVLVRCIGPAAEGLSPLSPTVEDGYMALLQGRQSA